MAANNEVMLYVREETVDIYKAESLLKSGSDVNAEDPKDGKCTALLYATKHSTINFHLIELLLKYGANIKAQNRSDGKCTALLYAVRSPNINYEVIELLLQNGADVNATSTSDGLSVLMHAITNINVNYQIIKLLLRYKANIKKKNKKDKLHTVLHYAIMHPNPNHKLIELLLENGAEINAKTYKEKKTALLYAIRKPDVDYNLIELLLKYKANPNASCLREGPPLPYLLKMSNFNFELIDLLLRNGAAVNVTNVHDGRKTPLLYAAKNRNCPYELFELLLKYKANVNSINYISNDSPLTYAVKHSNLNLTELFLKNKARIHQWKTNYSALPIAVRKPRSKKKVVSSQSETDESRPRINEVTEDELELNGQEIEAAKEEEEKAAKEKEEKAAKEKEEKEAVMISNQIKMVQLLLKFIKSEHPMKRIGGDCESCLELVKFVVLEQVIKNPSCICIPVHFYGPKVPVLWDKFIPLFWQHFRFSRIIELERNCVCELKQIMTDGLFPLLFRSPVHEQSFSQPQALVKRLISIRNDNTYPIYWEVLKSVSGSKGLLCFLGGIDMHAKTSFEKTAKISFLDYYMTLDVIRFLSFEDMLNLAEAFFGVSDTASDSGTASENECFDPVPKRQRLK